MTVKFYLTLFTVMVIERKMVIVIWKLLYQVHTSCIVMEAFVNKERDS